MIAYTLEQAENDLMQVYWFIRTSRKTSWKHVNKARGIKAALKRMGIKKHEIDDACYCLRNIDCDRCKKNANVTAIPCYRISERRKTAAQQEQETE